MKHGKFDILTRDRGKPIRYTVSGYVSDKLGIGINKWDDSVINAVVVTDLATGYKICSAGTVAEAYREYLKVKDKLAAERKLAGYADKIKYFESFKEGL